MPHHPKHDRTTGEGPEAGVSPGVTAAGPSGPAGEVLAADTGRYELLDEIARGGMGVVYRATDRALDREVAVKVLLDRFGPGSAVALRFVEEARITGQLQHPGIPPVHDFGALPDGRPFLAMKLIKGKTLSDLLFDRRDPAADRGRFVAAFEQLCQAVAYAHAHRVIHRDLKPSNVMVGKFGEVQVMDWGLAKVLPVGGVPADEEPDRKRRPPDDGTVIRTPRSGGSDTPEGFTPQTRAGSVLGTPAYMAPEQAGGEVDRLDARCDVFGLGAILCEVLTDEPPYTGRDEDQVYRKAMAANLTDARIRLAACGAEPGLVELCRRCLAAEPDERPRDAGEVASAVAGLRSAAEDRARQAEVDRARAETRAAEQRRRRRAAVAFAGALALAAAVSTWLAVRATDAERTAVAAGDAEAEERRKAVHQTELANQRAEDLAWEDYINRVNRAYREVKEDNVALAEDLLHGCPVERRGWEWHHVKRLCHPERMSVEVPAGSVSAIAYSPDGRLIATGSGGHFSRGGGGSSVELWDRETGRRRPTLHRMQNVIWSLAFSPDGTKLALGGTNPQVEVRDVKTGEILWAKHEPQLPQAMSIVFNPDGKSLAAGFGQYSVDGVFQVKLYEVATGRETVTFTGPRGGVNDLAFHRDGRHLAVAGSEVVEVWDVAARTKVRELKGHSKWVYGVAYSPDGKWLATGGWDRTIKLRDAATGEERLTIFGHQGFVLDLAFTPDSRSLASTSEDRSVRLWEVPSGRQLGVFHGHTGFVQAVAFAPDGRELASGAVEGTMKVWDLRTSIPVTFAGHTGWVGRLWYRRDGRRVISAAIGYQVPGETTKGWDPWTGDVDAALTGIDPDKLGGEFLPPSSFPSTLPPQPVTSPDGTRLARVRAGAGWIGTTDRSKDYANNAVQVLDAASGRVLNTLIGHTETVVGIAFSPDGRRIATASFDRTVKLWDTVTGREVFTLRGHTAGLLVLAFSPDGRRIVSGGIDFSARAWDATPLPTEILEAQDAQYQKKVKTLGELTRENEDTQRAEDLARSGQWGLAAAAYGRFVEQEPSNPGLRYPHIRSLVEAGDSAGVRRACEDLLRRIDNPSYSTQTNSLVWSCVLTPDAVADPEVLVRLAESLMTSHPEVGKERGDLLNTLGAALYRAGRFEEAIRRLNEGIQARGGGGVPKELAFLALAHHRLGHHDEAKRWLDKLVAYQPKKGHDFSWDDVEIRILRREAESLISGNNSPARSSPTTDTTGGRGSKPE